MTANRTAVGIAALALSLGSVGLASASSASCSTATSQAYGNQNSAGVQPLPTAFGGHDGVLLAQAGGLQTPASVTALDAGGAPRWQLSADLGRQFLVNQAQTGADQSAEVLTLRPETVQGCEHLRMAVVRAADGRLLTNRDVLTTAVGDSTASNLVAAPVRQGAGTGLVVEQRTFGAASGFTVLDQQGRQLTPTAPVTGQVSLLDGSGAIVKQWTQPPAIGPGPMAVGYPLSGGTALAVLRTTTENGPAAATATVDAVDSAGRPLWQSTVATLHDASTVLATRRGPVFVTQNLALLNVNGLMVPTGARTGARITALDGGTGALLWSKDLSAQAQVYASGGDLLVDAPDLGSTQRLRADDGQALWSTSLTRGPAPLATALTAAGDLTGENASSLLSTGDTCLVSWVSGATGTQYCHPELAPYRSHLLALRGLTDQNHDDLLAIAGQHLTVSGTDPGTLLLTAISGRDGSALWRQALSGTDASPLTATPRLLGPTRDLVLYSATDRTLSALDGRTGNTLWVRGNFAAPAAR